MMVKSYVLLLVLSVKCVISKDTLALTVYTHTGAALQRRSILFFPFTEILKAMYSVSGELTNLYLSIM